MSVTGSVLEYSNELFVLATPAPIVSKSTSPRLSDDQLTGDAKRTYPGYRVVKIGRAVNPDEAVDIWLRRGAEVKQRLFDPRTGRDLGNSVPRGIWLISRTIDLHDNLFAGTVGRKINGAGAIALLVMGITGFAIWWPVRSLSFVRARRSLRLLHGTLGAWSFAFFLIFGASGAYLSFPDAFQNLADRIEPPTAANAGIRAVDKIIYWLAFVHFGRVNGIGIPCSGPGVCDQATKAVWAIFGLAPAVMFVTGAILWWKRVLRPRLKGR